MSKHLKHHSECLGTVHYHEVHTHTKEPKELLGKEGFEHHYAMRGWRGGGGGVGYEEARPS